MFLSRPLPQNDLLRRFGTPPATLGEALGATFRDPTLRPGELLEREEEIAEAEGAEPLTETQRAIDRFRRSQRQEFGAVEEREEPEILSQDTLNKEYGHLGLEFDAPTSRQAADILAAYKREEIIRQDVIARGPSGIGPGILQFGAGLAGALTDPINIVASFVPVAGEARWAGFLAKQSRLVQRGARGFTEGVVGNTAIEIPVFGLARSQQLDYEFSDALFNVVAGGFIGAGGRIIGGAIADRLRPLPVEANTDITRLAISQAINGKSVNVDRVVSAYQRNLLSGTSLSTRRPVVPTSAAQIQDQRVVGQEARTDAETPVVRGPIRKEAPIVRFRRVANDIEQSLPSVPDGHVRLWRGNRPNELGKNPSFTDDLAGIALPFQEAYRGPLSYIDIPADDLRKYARTSGAATDAEFIVPSEIASDAKVAVDADSLSARYRSDNEYQQFRAPTRLPISDIKEIAAFEGSPRRDLTADFEAADEAAILSKETIEAQAEADFLDEYVRGLESQGIVDAGNVRQELNNFIGRAEQFGRGAKEAAVCLSRNA